MSTLGISGNRRSEARPSNPQNDPPADVITYPDSTKWFVKPHRKCFTIQEIDDYADEE